VTALFDTLYDDRAVAGHGLWFPLNYPARSWSGLFAALCLA